ncbi:MAG TPA: cytochrome b/b6 domain-containing protein [Terriglobales bacterium]|nr:cytochrome b/b6 domain-containing protein [Terriglobales bacterium]
MGGLFQHAPDRSGFPYLSQLSPELLWTLLWLAIAFCAIHALRRARGFVPGKAPARYNWNQRLYHWGNFLLLALVAFSGYWLFFRHAPPGLFGFTWLDIHSYSGLAFAVGVIVHAVAATLRGDTRSMAPEWRDFREAGVIWRNFLGKTNEYPAPGKYDALQKIYHHILSLLAITFTASGVFMWLSSAQIYLAPRSAIHLFRVTHDISAFLLAVMVVGHVYFSIIKANRHNLKDMTGLRTSTPEREAAD